MLFRSLESDGRSDSWGTPARPPELPKRPTLRPTAHPSLLALPSACADSPLPCEAASDPRLGIGLLPATVAADRRDGGGPRCLHLPRQLQYNRQYLPLKRGNYLCNLLKLRDFTSVPSQVVMRLYHIAIPRPSSVQAASVSIVTAFHMSPAPRINTD